MAPNARIKDGMAVVLPATEGVAKEMREGPPQGRSQNDRCAKRNLGALIARNASVNLLRLAGTGIVALLLPPFLVRELPKATYGAWALLLQLTLYVSYFDFGIQTAVARFVAHTEELDDSKQRDGVVSTALAMLAVAAIVGCIFIGVLAWRLPEMFRQMPAGLHQPAQLALLLMGGSFALGLPASVVSALFTGMQRNEIPAIIAIANKFAMALLVVGAVLDRRGIAAMGVATAIANMATYCGAFTVWRKYAPQVRLRVSLISKTCLRKISSYSGSVMVWMLAMLMISGLDLIVVGIFDYKATAYYAVAATLTNLIAQVQGAIFAAMLPASSALAARGDAPRLGELLVSSTRYGMLILLSMSLPLIVGGHYILHLWANDDYAAHSTSILQVLVVANVIRLAALPYSTLLLGTGQQGKVLISPLAEGITNLTASVAGAYYLGAIGVALGTLVGSIVSIGLHVFYNMPRTAQISMDRRRFIKEGLLRPIACALPVAVIPLGRNASPEEYAWLACACLLISGLMFWRYGLGSMERRTIAGVCLNQQAKTAHP